MQLNIGNVNYNFIPSSVVSFENIIKNKITFENDIYKKYESIAEISGELIVCNDATKMKNPEKKIIRETYDSYLKTLEIRDPKKDKWIYNILDGISEQDTILYKDELCIVVPNYKWNSTNLDKLHILCLPMDTSLRSIRSLTLKHIPLLKHMKKVTTEIIKKKYNIDEGFLKMFFHYDPSTYHLHIHFSNVSNIDSLSSVEYSHELNNVMFNLFICSDYYQKAILNKKGK
jgi:m7GpppX diphosphatase